MEAFLGIYELENKKISLTAFPRLGPVEPWEIVEPHCAMNRGLRQPIQQMTITPPFPGGLPGEYHPPSQTLAFASIPLLEVHHGK